MVYEKVDATHGEMLKTTELGEEINELHGILIFSVSCPIGNLEVVLGEGCQEKFAKISHLSEAGHKMDQIEYIPLSVNLQFLHVFWMKNIQDLSDNVHGHSPDLHLCTAQM